MSGSSLKLRDLSDVKLDPGTTTDEAFLVHDAATGKFGARVIADTDIPATIARDTEVTAAIAAALGYTSYVALLTQSGNGNPSAIVLHNSLGGAIVWEKSTNGIYTGTLAGAFTANKTAIFSTPTSSTFAPVVALERTSADVVTLHTVDYDGQMMDSGLSNTAIEIRVYA